MEIKLTFIYNDVCNEVIKMLQERQFNYCYNDIKHSIYINVSMFEGDETNYTIWNTNTPSFDNIMIAKYNIKRFDIIPSKEV